MYERFPMTTRLPRFLTYSLAAAIPAMGLAIGLGTAAGASTVTAAPAASQAAAARAAAKAAIEHLTVGSPRSANHSVSGFARPGAKGLTDVVSTNWSGYADTGSGFSKVSSTWTEPTPSCSGRTEELAAFWVGIDGYTSS